MANGCGIFPWKFMLYGIEILKQVLSSTRWLGCQSWPHKPLNFIFWVHTSPYPLIKWACRGWFSTSRHFCKDPWLRVFGERAWVPNRLVVIHQTPMWRLPPLIILAFRSGFSSASSGTGLQVVLAGHCIYYFQLNGIISLTWVTHQLGETWNIHL